VDAGKIGHLHRPVSRARDHAAYFMTVVEQVTNHLHGLDARQLGDIHVDAAEFILDRPGCAHATKVGAPDACGNLVLPRMTEYAGGPRISRFREFHSANGRIRPMPRSTVARVPCHEFMHRETPCRERRRQMRARIDIPPRSAIACHRLRPGHRRRAKSWETHK
jgi:hypothetical protein